MALEPPPTQATTASGSRPAACQDLRARLVADDRLEVAHHDRVGVRPGHRADDVVGVLDVRHPVAHGLVHRVLQRARARLHRPPPVRPSSCMRKTFSACRSTSSAPMKTSQGSPKSARGGGRGHAVLAGAGLGDDAPLAHAPRQQHLAERVVDLVRAGVAEVLALEHDAAPPASAPMRSASPSGVGRPTKSGQQPGQLLGEGRVAPGLRARPPPARRSAGTSVSGT